MTIHAPAQPGRTGAQAVQHHYLTWTIAVVGAGALLCAAVLVAPLAAPPATPEAPAAEPGAPVVNPHTGFTQAVPGAPVVNPHTGFTVEPAQR